MQVNVSRLFATGSRRRFGVTWPEPGCDGASDGSGGIGGGFTRYSGCLTITASVDHKPLRPDRITLEVKSAGARSAEIRLLRAMWRALETELGNFLNGHEGGNAGYSQGGFLRIYAPALDPTRCSRLERATAGRNLNGYAH